MNTLKILFSVILTLGSCVTYAQPSKFQGAFGQLGVGYESAVPIKESSTLSVSGASIPVNTSSTNASSMIGTFSLGYYQNVAKGFLLGVGAEYSPFAGSSANMTVTSTNALPGQSNITKDYRYQKQNSFNVFISPAMMVGADGLAYAKIGFTGAKVNYYNSLSYNLAGYSLGLGYKQFFSGSWYGFIEANYAQYGSQTKSTTNPLGAGSTLRVSGTSALSTYNGVVGVGYRF